MLLAKIEDVLPKHILFHFYFDSYNCHIKKNDQKSFKAFTLQPLKLQYSFSTEDDFILLSHWIYLILKYVYAFPL